MEQEAPKKSGGLGKIAIGCGIVVLIVIVLLAVGGWYVYNNARGWMAKGLSSVVNEAVDQSNLPDVQKQAITDRVDHVMQEFADGNITLDQIGQAVNSLEVENLVTAGMAQYIGTAVMDSSSLSDDDKADGRQAMNRLAHGVLENQVDESEIQKVFDAIMEDDGDGGRRFKQNPSDEELNDVIQKASDLADQAGIPDDVQEVDFAKRVGEAFDKALGTTQP